MPSARSEIEAVVSRDRLSLEDWLVHTGFHDDNYREQELSRYRALREAIRAVDQQAKELEENLLQLRLRHIQVYKKHIEMEQQEADLLSRLDQLRQNRANTTAEPLPPIVLPPLEETTAGSSQDAPMEEGEIPHAMHEYFEQHEQSEQHEQIEQHEQSTQSMKLDQSRHASPALSRSPSLVLSPGSPIHTPGQHDSDGSGTSLRGREAPGYNQSRDRTRSPGVITRPRSAHRGYRDRSNALSYNGPNLGATSDTRFFLVKSASINNVYASQDENLWACGYPTIDKLSEAFESGSNVILFFSANKSFGFQGYARMLDLPSSQNSKPSWYSKVKWKISEPFRVEWICTTSCVGGKMGGMRNSLVPDPQSNRGQLVIRSRDGDELDAPCGYAMKCILDQESRNGHGVQKLES